ncbi:hypothetical protein CEXT_680991 [Caerostris extrusa]|uniref:Uncharacterized protein n=1 Tax=Caerostris extrusa TaxID=172846 RepID=A0AAV4WP31_CAEEX|nr:hypothetical protein CEXT_680991 [Caerostris extrusa]
MDHEFSGLIPLSDDQIFLHSLFVPPRANGKNNRLSSAPLRAAGARSQCKKKKINQRKTLQHTPYFFPISYNEKEAPISFIHIKAEYERTKEK